MSALAVTTPPPTPRLSARLFGYGLGVAYALAATVTAVAVFLAVSATQTPTERGTLPLLWLLGLNLLLILPLVGAIGWRVLRLRRANDPSAQLHLRFVSLFAVAALIPAILVALVFGLLVTQGVDRWFDSRVRTAVESSATVSQSYLNSQTNALAGEVPPIADDFRRAGDAWRSAPEAFTDLLRREVEIHLLDAVYLIDGQGRVLGRAELPAAPTYAAPAPQSMRAAATGELVIRTFETQNLLRALMRVPETDTYVYVTRRAQDLNTLVRASDAVLAYRDAAADREGVQAVFALIYTETALLVLIAAVWLGMAAAGQLSEPLARVVHAAERISAGDLDVRVAPRARSPEAIAVLASTFNRMTGDLRAQQEALRTAGEEARDRSRFIETVLSDVSAGVIGADEDGQVTTVNRQALRLLDVDEAQALGHPLPEVAPELREVADAARASRDEAEAEMEIVRPGGARRIRARASLREDGGLVLTFDDITRLVAAQRSEAWKDVARRIAHEIKNPLTPIQLSAERLRRKYRARIGEEDVEVFDRCTDTIVRQVGDIGRMVDEFSAFARMPAPRFEEADAAEMLRQAVFSQRVADAEVDVALNAPDRAEPVVCDERMIAQALLNVLKNAAESVEARRAREGGASGGVRARLRAGDTYVAFEIEDDGVGLPTTGRERLTEPYVTTREKGTGLGLAIVKRILEDHGGEFVLTDADTGQGAKAVLRMPRRARPPARTET